MMKLTIVEEEKKKFENTLEIGKNPFFFFLVEGLNFQ